MRKLFGILIKILPLLTLYKGITSGGARLGPFVDTIKVALTQYEVGQITKHTYEDFAQSGKVPEPQNFSQFIKDEFHSQYSVLARELNGDKGHDHSMDIWGNPYQLHVNQNIGQIKVFSAGPDGIPSNKDDVLMDFSYEVQKRRHPAELAKQVSVESPIESHVEELSQTTDFSESESEYDEEGYNQDGYNQEGFDRDGYDSNGYHRSEFEEVPEY